MAATRTPRFDGHALPARPGPRGWCESDHCHTPGGFCGPHKLSPRRSRTLGKLLRTWNPPTCRSASPSCSPRLRTRLSSRSYREPAPGVAGRPVPTSASAWDAGGFPFRPERSTTRQHRRGGPFFQRSQASGSPFVGRLVPLALHRVLGTLDREPFLMHNPPQLVVAEANAGLLLQVRVETRQRPDTEAVAQLLRRSLNGCLQGGTVLGRRSRCASRRLARYQPFQTALSIMFADIVHGPDAAPQSVCDRRLRAPHRAHQDNGGIAKHRRVACSEPQLVECVPFLARQLPCRHDRLLAIDLAQLTAWSLPSNQIPQKFFCGAT